MPPTGSRSHRRAVLLTVPLALVLAATAAAAGGLLVGREPAPTPTAPAAIGGPNVELTPSLTPTAAPTHAPTPTPTASPPATPEPSPAGPTSVSPEELRGFVWPLRNARITSRFGQRDDGLVIMGGERYHDGIDLATWCGDKIRAAHGGTVLYAGRKFDEHTGYSDSLDAFYARLDRIGGLKLLPETIVIDYGNGYRGLYAHLIAGSASVKAGDVVEAGQVIGREGATGRATGCHLHYALIRMDGAWLEIAPNFVESLRYPPFVRERVDPLLAFPIPDGFAPRRFQPVVTPPPPSPIPFN
jgi:murein DD-endopeptidase MepM/ murein hydrolase activator NlpD